MDFHESLFFRKILTTPFENKSILQKLRDIDKRTHYGFFSDYKELSDLIKTINREDLFKELMIKNLNNKSLQLLAVHHILTGPDRYTIDDLTKILQPIRKISFLSLYKYHPEAVYTMLEDKSPEEAYKTIHIVYGRFQEIEDQLVILYSLAVLKHEVFHSWVGGPVTEKKLNISSRVRTEISNIGCKRKMTIIQGLVEQQLDWSSLFDPRSSCSITLMILVLYHELFTQHSSSDESEEYSRLIQKLMAALNHNNRKTIKCSTYYFETCFDLQTTSPEQCLSIVGNMFDSNLSYARKIKLGLVKHLQSKLSPDKLKSNEFKVLMFIAKWEELKWYESARKTNLQLKNELESVLTSTDTTHHTEMLMKYTQEIASLEVKAYIKLMTCHVLVTRGKHEQLAVVSHYLDAITHQLEPDILRFYCKICLLELNPKEKVEWIQKHYCEQLPVIGAMLKVEVYIELLMKMDYVTLMEMRLADDKIICQPTFIYKSLLHPKSRANLELVLFIINNGAISNKIFKKLSCDRLSAYIKLLLLLYSKENKPEIEKVLKNIIQQYIEESKHCADSDRVCHKELTEAASHNGFFRRIHLPHFHFSGMSREEELRSNIKCMYENPHLASTENMKAIWANILIPYNITETILLDFIHLMIMKCKKQDIAKLVLDTDISKCYLGQALTMVAPVFQIGENVKYEEFIYKCFCIVRHHNRVDHAYDKAISEYREIFPFLKAMEANDEMEKLSTFRTIAVLLILLLLSSALGSTSSQLKKYLALKYEYKDAILYLLWCSGDVEINPGPTLKKLRKVPDSQKERSWIYGGYTLLLKVIKGCNLETKTDRLWEKAPTDWPTNEPFHNPRKKQKGGKYDDQKLMKNLFELCEKKGKSIPQYFQNEYTAWINKDRKNLSQLYTCRTESKTLSEAVQNLAQYKDDDKLKTYLQERKIHIIFPTETLGSSKPTIHYPDIVRDLITTICRLCKGLPLTEKSDGIFNTPPKGWNKNHKYYSPCNAGKRTEKDQDKKLLKNLITYCESNKIVIPPEVAVIIRAWQTGDSKKVCEQYTIWAGVCIIHHSLEYLQVEKDLDKAIVQQCLENIGIYRTDSGEDPSKSTEQPKSKTELKSSSNTVQNDTETPSTSSYNTGSLVKSVDDSAVKSGLISSACEDVSMVVTVPLDQSVTIQKGKPVKRKYKTTGDQEPAKKVATSSVQAAKNPTNVKDDTSKSTDSVQDSPTLTTTSEDDNSKTDNKDSSNIQQINQMVEKTSSNDTDQNNGSPDSANSSYSGTVMNSLIDANKGTNNPNDTTTDEMDVDKIQSQLNALNNDLPQEFDEDLDTYLNSQNLQSSNLDIVFTLLEDDL